MLDWVWCIWCKNKDFSKIRQGISENLECCLDYFVLLSVFCRLIWFFTWRPRKKHETLMWLQDVVTGLTNCPYFSTAPPACLAKRPTFCNESRLRWGLMNKSGRGTYKKFHFETCAVHFMQIVCTIYGKAHGVMQIHQNKYNFLVLAAIHYMCAIH